MGIGYCYKVKDKKNTLNNVKLSISYLKQKGLSRVAMLVIRITSYYRYLLAINIKPEISEQ
jgi:hypothetical protein